VKIAVFDRLEEASSAFLASLRRVLREAAFDDAFLGACESIASNQPDVLRVDLVRWHLRRRDGAAAVLARLFAYGDAVDVDRVERVFGQSLLREAIELGLMDSHEGIVRAPFRIVPVEGLDVLSDDLTSDGDPVMGPGRTTQTLIAALPLRPQGDVLDVGCGAGTVALVAAARGARVVAVDISPRAIAMTRFNARLNDMACDARVGDLTVPAGDEQFDWIVSQPPFVASPDPEATTFLHGGRRGDELLLRLLAEIPPRLRVSGRALVLADLPDVGESWARRVAQHLGAGSHGILVNFGGVVDADMLAIQLGAFASSAAGRFGDRIVAYRAHLAEVGVARTLHALIDVRGSDVAFAAERRWERFGGVQAADFEVAWRGAALASQAEEVLLASRLRLPEGARIRVDRDPVSDRATIRLEASTVRHELSEGAAAVLETIVACTTVSDALREVLPPDAPRGFVQEALRLVRSLLVSGALVPFDD
jgi:SAM-dependent methyltransferase